MYILRTFVLGCQFFMTFYEKTKKKSPETEKQNDNQKIIRVWYYYKYTFTSTTKTKQTEKNEKYIGNLFNIYISIYKYTHSILILNLGTRSFIVPFELRTVSWSIARTLWLPHPQEVLKLLDNVAKTCLFWIENVRARRCIFLR